jgi:hypothetical protein
MNGLHLEHSCYLNKIPPWTYLHLEYLWKMKRFTPQTFMLLEPNFTLNGFPPWTFLKNDWFLSLHILEFWTEFHLNTFMNGFHLERISLNTCEFWMVFNLKHLWTVSTLTSNRYLNWIPALNGFPPCNFMKNERNLPWLDLKTYDLVDFVTLMVLGV